MPYLHDGGAGGFRDTDTSRAGAEAISEDLPKLQRLVMGIIRHAGKVGATGDEIARALGWEKWRVRPRTSELRNARKIMDSGLRRQSDAGVQSIVWIAREVADA